MNKEYPLRSANAGFMPTLVHAVFLDAPYANCPAKTQHFRSRAFFCAGRIPATPGNANCIESSGGRGRFAKRRTTGPHRNGHDCLNAATVLDCRAWASTHPANRAHSKNEDANSEIQMARLISPSKRISHSLPTSRHAVSRPRVKRFPPRAG